MNHPNKTFDKCRSDVAIIIAISYILPITHLIPKFGKFQSIQIGIW